MAIESIQPNGQVTLYPERIPVEMINTRQWVCWRYEMKEGKPSKVPQRARGKGRASSIDPETWGTFSEALATMKRLGHTGIGFMFAGDWVGVDFDNCLDPETNIRTPWVIELLVHFAWGAYIEASPSGTGIHVIGKGKVPGEHNKADYQGGKVELYDADSPRFFTVTGNVLSESGPIGDITAGLDIVYQQVFPPKPAPPPLRALPPLSLDDERVLELAFGARNGAETRRIYDGDMSYYGNDHSDADLGLLSRLAFYTQDTEQLDRLFRRSGLYRKKWDRADYRERTFTLALQQHETYDPGRHNPPPAPEVTYTTAGPSTDERIAALEARVTELERALAEERAARSEMVYALRNKAVKTERGTAIAAACLLEHKKSQDQGVELPGKGDGWHRVYLDAVAEQAGCSTQRASAHLDRLAEWGVIEKTLHWGSRDRYNLETGERVREGVKEMYLRSERSLSQTLAVLATIEPEKPQTWGGARAKVCPDHPEAGTVKKWSLHCQECDRLIDEGEDNLRPPSFQDEGSSNTATTVVDTPTFQDESTGGIAPRPLSVPKRSGPPL